MNADDTAADLLTSGREALRRLAWQEARAAFEGALGLDESPEALEGLAQATTWLHDDATLDYRERAFHSYRSRGDRAAAARNAIWLAVDLVEFRGAEAVANGWVQRARRLLDELDPVPEHAWMALYEALAALMGDNDPAAAIIAARQAGTLGRQLDVFDVEMTALALEGLAVVSSGDVAAGMRLLDEAATAAVADEVADASMRSTILCSLMDACDRVRDFERASQWATRAREASARWGIHELFSTCRPHYAVVLTWRGAWEEAEAQLQAAIGELTAIRPPMAVESIVRLAELRTLQGRFEDAAMLFAQVEHAPLAQLGRARLALAHDDAPMAVELIDRFLRRIPASDRVERAVGLELMVRAQLASGDIEAAAASCSELHDIAGRVAVPSVSAAVCSATGLLARAHGEREAARHAFEEAVDRYGRAAAPFETACARLELAVEFREAGLLTSAHREALGIARFASAPRSHRRGGTYCVLHRES